VLLKHLLESGLSKTAIADQLGISRRLVYHLIATGQLDRDLGDGAAPRARVTTGEAKLAAVTPLIEERLTMYPALSAVRLFAECRAAGYTGGYSQLTALVRRLRPVPEPEAVVRFETAPGEQAQFDFATVKLPWGVRYALVMVLGFSRLLYVEFVLRQTALAVMLGMERAFAAFGGVPRHVLFDQMKSVVIDDQRPDGGRLLVNPEFLRFAAHWHVGVRACRPYRAQTKGKVERPIHYLRHNFLYGRTFLGDGDLADQCARWVHDVANVRVHGTLHERPVDRWQATERAALQPLAARPYQSLLLPAEPPPVSVDAVAPRVTVERRGLASYAALAEGR
jgi:transposase